MPLSLELIMVRSRPAAGRGVHRKRGASVTLATPAPDHTAWMPQPCRKNSMNEASMQYEHAASPGSGAPAAHRRPLWHHGHRCAPGPPVHDQNKLCGIDLEVGGLDGEPHLAAGVKRQLGDGGGRDVHQGGRRPVEIEPDAVG